MTETPRPAPRSESGALVPGMPTTAYSLDGQTILVTGAGSRYEGGVDCLGTGAATALMLATAGASVALVDTNEAAIYRTMSLAGAAEGRLLPVIADVSVEESARTAVRSAVRAFGGLTALVNNVGITGTGSSVTHETLEGWSAVLDVNLTGAFLMCRYGVPEIVRAGGGSVTNISSIGAIRGITNAAYAASKGGMISLSTSMAYAYGRDRVRVNTVLPGHLSTPMGRANDDRQPQRQSANLLGVDGTANDVAHAVTFLVSPAARWITGVVLLVDGGASTATGLGMFDRMSKETT